ncbi:M28 family peptidase [Chlorogloeopsis fritschii PCC 9212]|uniref:Peptidase M28 n=1 Tax=Chlorogloeopsis fritschii PCC 6912 TaxID=211165 RepID=A0A433NHR7_CHLFR|nr:M28 family peptidase [Chlorogloeopsis fritschii]RUR81869.1 peptidase M28 [Chlorogloeopsis fritschii PCC 6912]
MKKWIWLVLAILVAFAAVVGSGFLRQGEQPSVIETIKVENPHLGKEDKGTRGGGDTGNVSLSASPRLVLFASSAPQVSANKLFAHVQNLNFKRYTDAERSRTRTYITRELKKLGWKSQLQKFSEGVNVFAERKGTDKQAGAILVGAHYDTVAISPGADDNASGVAVLLEIARLLGSRPTPRTLQLVFFDKEEAGLLGSRAFVTKTAHLLKNLRGVIVMDMVGYACHTPGCQKYPAGLPITPPSDKGDFLAVVGDTENLPLLNVFQYLNSVAVKPENKRSFDNKNISVSPHLGASASISLPPIFTLPVPFKGLLIPDTLRSDHAPFWLQGVGAVLVTDTANLRSPHYHQPSDTPKTIDRNFFTGAAQVVVNATTVFLENQKALDTPKSNS